MLRRLFHPRRRAHVTTDTPLGKPTTILPWENQQYSLGSNHSPIGGTMRKEDERIFGSAARDARHGPRSPAFSSLRPAPTSIRQASTFYRRACKLCRPGKEGQSAAVEQKDSTVSVLPCYDHYSRACAISLAGAPSC